MKTAKFKTLTTLCFVPVIAIAQVRTVILDVQNMTCPVCPLTIKTALSKVPGVQQVTVDFERKTATVKYEETAVIPDKLTEATESAGFPSTVKLGHQ